MVGVTTVMQTSTPTADRIATHSMGAADLAIREGPGGSIELLRERLPAGSVIQPMLQTGANITLPGMAVSVALHSFDPEGLARGVLTLVDGRFPNVPGEVAMTAEAVRFAKVAIGDRLEVEDLGSLQVVGYVENEMLLKDRAILVDSSVAEAAVASEEVLWLVRLPSGVDPHIPGLTAPSNPGTEADVEQGDGTEPAFFVVARADILGSSNAAAPATVVLGGLALVHAALIAAAAFAVGVRRRQRELGLMAAAGAEPRHVTASLLAEAILLGALGAATGVVAGLIGALIASPFLDNLNGQRNPPIALDLALLVLAGLMGMAASFVAALAPAWAAARAPVLALLHARRPQRRSARRSIVIGVGVIGVAIALTLIGATQRFEGSDSDGTLSVSLLLGGAVLGTLGFGVCSPWLLELLDRPASRFPLATRIALRETARARARNGPIVTALLAAFAATVALAAYQSSQNAITAASWRPPLQPEQIFIFGSGGEQSGPEAARVLGAEASAPIRGAIGPGGADVEFLWISPGDSNDPNAALSTFNVAVGDAELLKALGAETAAADLAAGSVILLSDKAAPVSRATAHVMNADGTDANRVSLPARVVALGVDASNLPGAVISAEMAGALGATPGPTFRYIVRLPRTVTDEDLTTAAGIAARYPDTTATASRPPVGADAAFRLVIILASLLFALTVTAVAVALGEAESRPEQRTLLALGADPGLRRRIAATRAGVIALLGGLFAVPAGLLPVWGLMASREAPLVVPVPEIVGAIALLPLLAIAGTWLLSRPISDWSAHRNVGV